MNTNRTIAAAPGRPGMSADRKAAIWIGVLYIIGTVGLVLSVIVTGGILTAPTTWPRSPRSRTRWPSEPCSSCWRASRSRWSRSCSGRSASGHNETLAIGYVVFRGAIETVIYIAAALAWLLLIALSTVAGCGAARRLRAHRRDRGLGPAGRHPVRSRRADVLRPALPVAARAPVAVRLGARGGRALHRAAAREHVRALARRPHGPARRAGDGHGGWLIAKGFSPSGGRLSRRRAA